MTVNDILAKLYEVNKIIETLNYACDRRMMITHVDGNTTVDIDKLEEILEDYKAMLGNMKVKE